jgi:hypothetical protein
LNLKNLPKHIFNKRVKNKMLPKHALSIPQNLLEYVNKKFVWHCMSKVWKYCLFNNNKKKKKKKREERNYQIFIVF